MPITCSVDRARQRLFTAVEGTVTHLEVMAHWEKKRDDNCLHLSELIDATQVAVAFSAAEVLQIAQLLRDFVRRNALGPTAIVTGDDVSYGMILMLEILVKDVCDVRPFCDPGEAEEWLNAHPRLFTPAQEG